MLTGAASFYIALAIVLISLGGLAAAAVAYMRAAKALTCFIMENGPNLWTDISSRTKSSRMASTIPDEWMLRLLIGITVLDIANLRYPQMLWAARKWLIVCTIFWLIGIIAVGWIFQNGRWPHF